MLLSYNLKNQELVKKVSEYLTSKDISVWMDIEGGIKCDLIRSMSKGVEGAAVIICFCTEKYQNSPNCQSELEYAYTLRKPIIPVISRP